MANIGESSNISESNNTLLKTLEYIASEIKISYVRDCDKTDSIKSLNNFLLNILGKNLTLEEIFNQDEKLLQYFMNDFMKDVIQYILMQPVLYGDNGDDIALELLCNIYKLFLKYHQNKKYSPLFEKIRDIINTDLSNHKYFSPSNENTNFMTKIENPKRKINSYNFNHTFIPDYIDTEKEKQNIYKESDNIDLLIKYESSRSQLDKKAWVRGKIKSVNIEKYEYIIECDELDKDITIPIGSYEIAPCGKKTKDWEWRRELKKFDVIDCYDRNKWFPSTVYEVNENVKENGYKQISYKIGFRLFPKLFKNKEDENDNFENYKCFWENKQIEIDPHLNEEFYGDPINFDESISFYSKRIQKFKSYTNTQKEFLNQPTQYTAYGYNNKKTGNKMQIMNYELENDGEINEIDENIFIYEKNGKKNYIFAKNSNYSYYYALFWKNLSDNDNIFEEFIKIINNKPNAEEILMVFYSLYYVLPYLHNQYLRENLNNFKNSILNFINNLDTKEIRSLPKDLIEVIIKFLKKVNYLLTLNKSDSENENTSAIDEITISLSLKMIKASIFDKRIQGIKSLSDYIDENNKNENSMKILINLIQKNEIIKEIFGANYHSQIISKSNKILQILLKYNELKEEDIKLIWDCTQRGDLEAKTTIMQLLSNLAEYLNESFINILLQSIINSIDKNKINEKEIDFIYNLSIHGDNENNKNKCCEYIYQCILKLDLDDNIQRNPIMQKLISLVGANDKYLDKILSMCDNDLKENNSSLIILQILSAILDRYTCSNTHILFLKDNLEEYTKNDKLLIVFKNNFKNYLQKIKEKIKLEQKENEENKIGNYDEIIIDNFTHVMNLQKRIEFLNEWITKIYPNFDFVEYLKGILLDNPISINDGAMFYDFMKKYISETKANESDETKEKRNNIKNKLFKIFVENNQNSMTISEFKLFMAIFLGINEDYLVYSIDKDDNYDIKLICENIEELKEMDKLWNLIFQLKDETVLNKSISIIFNIYKNKDQTDKLLNKCSELIKNEKESEKIDKCFKILRTIIIESEKNNIIKIKSHSNLIKNSLVYLPINLKLKIPINSGFYYSDIDKEKNANENICEIFYGNTTINEIKEILIEKGKIPLNYLEVDLSKEYMKKIKENEKDTKKEKEKKEKLSKMTNEDKILDDTCNNKSIMEILNKNNYNIDLLPNKIFIFYKKKMLKVNLLEDNHLNPKLELILKEWFNEFTGGTGKMDPKGCSLYISKVTTTREKVPENDDRITNFFRTYDKDNLGYVTEEKFLEFYLSSLNSKKDDIVWENLNAMGVREDLHKKDEPEEIPYIEKDKLPRYSLGNDKELIDTLFNMYNNFETKKEIFEFLFFLTTNKEIYDNILNNLNKKEENNFDKIFVDKNKILEQLYVLTIIESILYDINVHNFDFTGLFEDSKKADEKKDANIVMKSKKYEYFDDIDINKKIEFLKELIINNNFEKLLKYMNNLLIEYKFDSKENNNIALSLCCEKCLKVINIIYNACFDIGTEKKEEKENISNNKGILILDCILSNVISEDEKIKQNISKISFLDFTTNLIKFISNMNNYLNIKENQINNENNKNLLENSFNLLINLISHNEKLLTEFDSKEEVKNMISSSLKNSLTCQNEYYKTFYVKCLLNSIQNISSSDKKINNKFLNLLFDVTNNIFNELLTKNNDKGNEHMTSKTSILFFDFFSLLSSTKTDSSGNEFLFKIYNILFNSLKDIESEKKVSKDNFIGLMNILIKRIKNNEDIKKEIINKEIEGKTLIEIILEKLYKNDENKKELIESEIAEEGGDPFINIDKIKQDKPKTNGIICKDIKNICNDYLIESFKSPKDSKIIRNLLSIIKVYNEKTSDENEENGQTKKKTSYSTKNYDHVGLDNIGCICYMNSIMQQIYMVPTFRYAIMGTDDHEPPKPSEYGRMSTKDDNLLHQLQIMYTFLTFSEKEDFNPKYFCYSFKDFDGNPTNPMIQQDSQEFYNNFCDKIENCIKKTKYKYIISDVFIGRTCSSVVCESCKHISNRFEDFYNLSLEVKNLYNLNDSLQKMISPEKIDDFKCSNCNQNVTISKRTSLCDLPNILVVHLKRFYMNYEIERTEKINSRFEFPMNLNLKQFCSEDIVSQISGKQFEDEDIYVKEDEYYQYELKGINIHMGSADGGHYFSLINVERNGENNTLIENNDGEKKYKWLKFNDSHVSIFDINDIEKECFGGAKKGSGYNYESFQNAYMLIYERKKKSPIRILYEEKDIKENNVDKKSENDVEINKDNRKGIKKEYDLFKKNPKVDENNLYKKLFKDEEKNEYYKYIPYYNIDKLVPRKIYNDVMEKNKKIEEAKNKNENDDIRYKKEYYDILLTNISSPEFNILSDNYDSNIKGDLINLLLENIFSSIANKYLQEEEKVILNSKTKIILDKIVLPFINPYIEKEKENEQKKEIDKESINNIKIDDNDKYISMIRHILIQKEKLEKIYVNDLTAVFDNENVESFSKIIEGLLVVLNKKKTKEYLTVIDALLELVKNIENASTYPTANNTESKVTPLYYIYNILYQATFKDKKTTEKLLNQNAIYTFLYKLKGETRLCRDIMYNILEYLIKNTEEYCDKLFDVKKDEKICNIYFSEKNYLIKNIQPSVVDLLFEERVDLLIILIKILQYNEMQFSIEFNRENIQNLFISAYMLNKIKDMIKIIYGILEINDKISFHRINNILGFPIMVIKQNEIKKEERNNKEEKKENEEEEKNNKNKKDLWPFFGERLIEEENDEGDKDNSQKKLNKHIFRYNGIIQRNPKLCILALLFPYEDIDKKKVDNKKKEIIEEKERIKLIYDLLKIMLLGKGNYCLFKYIYLLPARTLYYKNLYEEMIDIIEKANKDNDNLYNLEEIKKNAEMCIKRIKYEVKKTLNELKNNNIEYEDYKSKDEYKLPENMNKFYVDSDEVEKFIGTNPNMIPSDIVKEQIEVIASGDSMFLMRLEYFTKYKNIEEIRNNLLKKDDKIKKKETEDEKKDKDNEEQTKEENDLNKKKIRNELEEKSDDDDEEHNIFKINVSNIKNEIDGKEFMFDMISKLTKYSFSKIDIIDNSIKDTKNVISSLIRFVIITTQSADSMLHINISEKNIPEETKENYYYAHFFKDNIKGRNISNFLNIYRIRNDLSFLKKNDIGINIDVKN